MRPITLTIVESKPGELLLSLVGEGELASAKVGCSVAKALESLRADPSRLEGFLTPTLVRGTPPVGHERARHLCSGRLVRTRPTRWNSLGTFAPGA